MIKFFISNPSNNGGVGWGGVVGGEVGWGGVVGGEVGWAGVVEGGVVGDVEMMHLPFEGM